VSHCPAKCRWPLRKNSRNISILHQPSVQVLAAWRALLAKSARTVELDTELRSLLGLINARAVPQPRYLVRAQPSL
jgi:hypothetical protein